MHFLNENSLIWGQISVSLFPRVQLTASQHWLWKYPGAKQETSYCLNQWSLSLLTNIHNFVLLLNCWTSGCHKFHHMPRQHCSWRVHFFVKHCSKYLGEQWWFFYAVSIWSMSYFCKCFETFVQSLLPDYCLNQSFIKKIELTFVSVKWKNSPILLYILSSAFII